MVIDYCRDPDPEEILPDRNTYGVEFLMDKLFITIIKLNFHFY